MPARMALQVEQILAFNHFFLLSDSSAFCTFLLAAVTHNLSLSIASN